MKAPDFDRLIAEGHARLAKMRPGSPKALRELEYIAARVSEKAVFDARLSREQAIAALAGVPWMTNRSIDFYRRENCPNGFFIVYGNHPQPPVGWHWGWVEGNDSIVLRDYYGDDFITREDVEVANGQG